MYIDGCLLYTSPWALKRSILTRIPPSAGLRTSSAGMRRLIGSLNKQVEGQFMSLDINKIKEQIEHGNTSLGIELGLSLIHI